MFVAASVYAVNKWLLKPHFSSIFVHSYLNDIFAMPFILGYGNLLITLGGLPHLLIATPLRIAGFTIFCATAWEIFGPSFIATATSDPADFVAYSVGSSCYFLSYCFGGIAVGPCDRHAGVESP
jgi:hypothetical protein